MAVGFFACEDQIIKPSVCNNLEAYNYAPSSYTVIPPEGFPAMEHPDDNPITVEGIELGRHLFYDPILSRDSTYFLQQLPSTGIRHLQTAYQRPRELKVDSVDVLRCL